MTEVNWYMAISSRRNKKKPLLLYVTGPIELFSGCTPTTGGTRVVTDGRASLPVNPHSIPVGFFVPACDLPSSIPRLAFDILMQASNKPIAPY